MCKAVTDNRNRTSGEIKQIFDRAGGNLGPSNCVAFQFTQKGVIIIERDKADEDQLMEIGLEAGADDVSSTAHIHEVLCAPEVFEQVRDAILAAHIEIQSADLSMVADNLVSLDAKAARKVMRLIDALEENDDVDAVYSNSDISDEVVAELSKDP